MNYPKDLSKNEQRRYQDRLDKIEQLKELGVESYPYTFEKKNSAKELLDKYKLEPEQKTDDHVVVAGRLRNFRRMGKAAFAHVQDQSGKIQVYFRNDDMGDNYEIVRKCETGDIVGVEGTIFSTKTGETTIYVSKVTMLSKALRDLPDKYHGVKDADLRFRQRYLDMIMNDGVLDSFVARSKAVRAIRNFFEQRNYLEVETPLLQTQYGGANASPFITHINAWDMKMYLSISPELYLKRLLVGGFERVFTICKNFRNEDVDHSHNPEFTMLEAYSVYEDYEDMMRLVEECFEYVATKVIGTTDIDVIVRDKNGEKSTQTISLKAPWKRISAVDAVKEELGIDLSTMQLSEIQQYCQEKKIDVPKDASWGLCLKEIFDELVEHTIIQPTHVFDRPKESTPLCKQKRGDDRLVEQCEPIIAGMEVANMYSELNDPVKQRELLEAQAEQLRGGVDDEAHPMDEDFAKAIEYGMPPAGGIGFGVDRFVKILLGAQSLREIILFPTVKPENLEESKK